MANPLDLVLSAIDEAYDRKSWHGTNLRGSLRRVSAGEALWRPGEGRHNVWELAVHAAYWKYAVRRRLRGGKRGSFALKGSNWFAAPARAGEAEWREVLDLLDGEHRALREAIAALPARALDDRKTRQLLTGIAAHDLYHAGQIQLVKRLSPW
ncbi:MAG TPA: DinB family protein [Thermoanaerobaculia bacterium]|nr:DinB family protein [Thermoanaerobaculia bacterium]